MVTGPCGAVDAPAVDFLELASMIWSVTTTGLPSFRTCNAVRVAQRAATAAAARTVRARTLYPGKTFHHAPSPPSSVVSIARLPGCSPAPLDSVTHLLLLTCSSWISLPYVSGLPFSRVISSAFSNASFSSGPPLSRSFSSSFSSSGRTSCVRAAPL